MPLQIIYDLWGMREQAPEPPQPFMARLRSILTGPPKFRAEEPEATPQDRDSLVIGPGWVYVLSNEAHPQYVKIGHSTDAPESRATELYSTGVPLPFIVEFKIYVHECGGLEAAAHEELKSFRVTKREFFRVSVEEAAVCIANLAVQDAPPFGKLIACVRVDGQLQTIIRSS
jgi:hypothetical protein